MLGEREKDPFFWALYYIIFHYIIILYNAGREERVKRWARERKGPHILLFYSFIIIVMQSFYYYCYAVTAGREKRSE